MGIDDYEFLVEIDNCEHDADEIASQVRGLSDGMNGYCVATVRKGGNLNRLDADQ